MVQERAKILLHRKIARDHYRMRLKSPAAARQAMPGQFLHILCRPERKGQSPHSMGSGQASGTVPLLRRPISLLDVDRSRGTLDIVYKVVGLGTRALAELPERGKADFIGPLGEPFTAPAKGKQALLIGGGVGIPPLVFLAKWLLQKRIQVAAFLGARTKEWVICREDFRKVGVPVRAATDDGTLGYKGSVVDLVSRHPVMLSLSKHDRSPFVLRSFDLAQDQDERNLAFYICGPTGRMAAAAELARRRGIPAQVSLEERMGCAMGCCMGCVVEVNTEPVGAHARFQRVCTEGPVFAAETIIWRKANGV
jgi:dihydroorotate dehydrogenase electron transfer subunit